MRSAILKLVAVLQVLLTLFSGPYRVVAYRFRTFGGIGTGLVTWAGIVIAYPVFVASFDRYGPSAPFLWAWLAFILAGWVQMFAKWCSTAPPRDRGVSHCWLGRWEPALAYGLCIAAAAICGPGGFVFFLTGYACSMAQIGLVRLREGLSAWTPDDTRRRLAPVHARAAQAKQAGSTATRVAFAKSLLFGSAAASVLQGGWILLRQRMQRPAAVAPEGTVAYRPPTFGNRVFTYVVGHTIFSLIFGTIGIGAIFSVFGFVLAIPLYFLGWDLSPPDEDREQARGVVQGVAEGYHDERDQLIDRLLRTLEKEEGSTGRYPR